MTPETLVRIRLRTSWPDGGSTLLIERKRPNRRSYEVLHILQCSGHITDADAVDMLTDLQEVVTDLLGLGGYGQEFLPYRDTEPY